MQAAFIDRSEAIELIYPMGTEDARVIWHGVQFRSDTSTTSEQCAGKGRKRIDVYFSSDTFRADWVLTCGIDSVAVEAKWRSVSGLCERGIHTRPEDRLNACPSLALGAAYFVEQWLKIVRRVVEDVGLAQVPIDDDSLLRRSRALLRRQP